MTLEADAVVVGSWRSRRSLAPSGVPPLFYKTPSKNQFFAAIAISSSFPQILTMAKVSRRQ